MRYIYCRSCADSLRIRPSPPTDPLASTYQQDKFLKHTQPSAAFAIQTVFDSTSTSYYADCVREAMTLGAVEVTSRGTNVIFCPSTGSSIGLKYKWGQYADRQDTVVVVKTTEAGRVHSFLEASSSYSIERCHACGGPVV